MFSVPLFRNKGDDDGDGRVEALTDADRHYAEEHAIEIVRGLRGRHLLTFQISGIRALFQQAASPYLASIGGLNSKIFQDGASAHRFANTRELLEAFLDYNPDDPRSRSRLVRVFDSVNRKHASLFLTPQAYLQYRSANEDSLEFEKRLPARVEWLRSFDPTLTEDGARTFARAARANASQFEKTTGLFSSVNECEQIVTNELGQQKQISVLTGEIAEQEMPHFLYVLATLGQELVRAMEESGRKLPEMEKHAILHFIVQMGKLLGMRQDWHPEYWQSYDALANFADEYRNQFCESVDPHSVAVAERIYHNAPEVVPKWARPFLGWSARIFILGAIAGTPLQKKFGFPYAPGTRMMLHSLESVYHRMWNLLRGAQG